MPAHPKPSGLERQRPDDTKPDVPFAYLRQLSDDDLDTHIGHLEAWLDFQQEEIEAAITERERRGGASYVLTPAAEAWLAANAGRQGALL